MTSLIYKMFFLFEIRTPIRPLVLSSHSDWNISHTLQRRESRIMSLLGPRVGTAGGAVREGASRTSLSSYLNCSTWSHLPYSAWSCLRLPLLCMTLPPLLCLLLSRKLPVWVSELFGSSFWAETEAFFYLDDALDGVVDRREANSDGSDSALRSWNERSV